jgi:hypothetical protein
MGKWIGLLVVLVLGFWVYWANFHKSPAYEAYLKWTQATMDGDCPTLYALSDGEAKKWVDSFCTGSAGMTILGQVTSSPSAASMVKELRATPQGAMRGLRRELEAETRAADGAVDLTVVESVAQRPSNFSKPAPPRRHWAKVRELGGVWKLVEFREEDVK